MGSWKSLIQETTNGNGNGNDSGYSLASMLTGHLNCHCVECVRTDDAKRIVRDGIVAQFGHCPIFAATFDDQLTRMTTATTATATATISSSREAIDVMAMDVSLKRAVCHLCKFNCYMRAFAPAREWLKLRKSISDMLQISPDRLLKGWSCHLHPPVPEQSDGNGKREGMKMKMEEDWKEGNDVGYGAEGRVRLSYRTDIWECTQRC